MSSQAEQKVKDAISQVKPFSHIIQEAISLIDSAKADSKKIASVLKQDLLLAARLLSIANSPFYGMCRKVDDIENAYVILGNNIIRNILISAGALDSFPVTDERNKIWYHSLEVATVSEYLAKKVDLEHGRAYMVGLLHDVGKFILLDAYPEHQSIIQANHTMSSGSSIEEEMNLMGINHAQAGATVIGVWNLPEEMQLLVEKHHYPAISENSKELTILQLADDICYMLGMKLSDDDLLNELKNDYFSNLQLTRDELINMIPDIREKLLSLDGVFEKIS